MHTLNADTIGHDGVWIDPVWRVEVQLLPLERELLRSWWVRRLAFIAHAGAASLTTVQTYSRLEHSLGVLALVAHFAPEDRAARAAALLHDVGHLPFSHTLEGIAGLEHHEIGRRRVRELGPVLERHGISPDSVIALDEGAAGSPLGGAPGILKLDHLDSFARSGQAHGRTVVPPAEILARCRLLDGAVDTDEETAAELTRLIVAEARAQRAGPNIVPIAVLRDLVTAVLAETYSALTPAGLAAMTDDELWAALLSSPSARGMATTLRRDPGAWRIVPGEGDVPGPGGAAPLEHVVARGYLSLPTVEGRAITSDEVETLERKLPVRYLIAGPG